ncbi:putative heparinase superfamily protein [Yoonia maritima]|uniref:Putative heparinase superfamily protein n=1 Tax=Yoonia maritima TaxID=1435347 RepID=A0A2T0VW61_9RHOB|nr:heparinase II/III family protein [Yoonia maritima]PRY75982.1 putative heparinase superfamily protein [Yoonia maritima]
MAKATTWRDRRTTFMNRVHARRAAFSDVTPSFVTPPEPRTIGAVGRGRQLITGNFLFSGLFVEGPNLSIWDIAHDNPDVMNEIHGSAWMDDLVAVGDEKARTRAQTWVYDWIKRYGNGRSAGWEPSVTGRRLTRFINHGPFILRGQDQPATDQFMRSLGQQTLFLSRRWVAAPHGLARFETLAGLIYAGLMLSGMDRHVDSAVKALAAECASQISSDGAIATRNPEELLEILTLLNLAAQTLTYAKRRIPRSIVQAIDTTVPTLRALRHSDGSLTRFHGGGSGLEGWLDQAFADSGVRTAPDVGLHMGFAKLTGGRTSLIIDASPPPTGAASLKGHASTLGFELNSGRRPIIVNSGSGARFGAEWRRASRATASHSTLGLDGVSSSRLNTDNAELSETPDTVRYNAPIVEGGRCAELSHNGYQTGHGLTHARILQLSIDGRQLTCEDLLTTLDDTDDAKFDAARGTDGVGYKIRFHLHPDVTATLDHQNVFLALKSGETWVFTHDGAAELSIIPSVYLQNGRLRPLGTHQVVLSGRAMSYATRVRWSLAKAQDTPTALRDLVQTDLVDDVEYTPGDFE